MKDICFRALSWFTKFYIEFHLQERIESNEKTRAWV